LSGQIVKFDRPMTTLKSCVFVEISNSFLGQVIVISLPLDILYYILRPPPFRRPKGSNIALLEEECREHQAHFVPKLGSGDRIDGDCAEIACTSSLQPQDPSIGKVFFTGRSFSTTPLTQAATRDEMVTGSR
jgi:hypothetical protein